MFPEYIIFGALLKNSFQELCYNCCDVCFLAGCYLCLWLVVGAFSAELFIESDDVPVPATVMQTNGPEQPVLRFTILILRHPNAPKDI